MLIGGKERGGSFFFPLLRGEADGKERECTLLCIAAARCKDEEGAGEDAANQKSFLLISYDLQPVTVLMLLIALPTFYLQ